MRSIEVVELFAGVGGFRVALTRASSSYKVVWFNQWEPGKSSRSQHAWLTYCTAFGEDIDECRKKLTNEDIGLVPVEKIPKHQLLVGGFPCQDYSVAKTLSTAHGLEGKKGVLWWNIYNILKSPHNNSPKYVLLENVDRLLGSPASQRGRDFAVMLSCFNELGYGVEWRIINAADYGMPQRRRRIFILAYKNGTAAFDGISKDPVSFISSTSSIASALPVVANGQFKTFDIDKPQSVSDNFNKNGTLTPFYNCGAMVDGKVTTIKTSPNYSGQFKTLGDVLVASDAVPSSYYIPDHQLPIWQALKGAKKATRRSKSGFEYDYTEGAVQFPDLAEKPSRTIITGEGGAGPSRFKHVVQDDKGLRRLLPVELERLNTFDDHHTAFCSDNQRAFFMGNALVVDVVTQIARKLVKVIEE